MFKKILIATILLYTVAHGLATLASDSCMGWHCQEITCPDEYAVMVPNKGYIPCEQLNEYIETKNQELLR